MANLHSPIALIYMGGTFGSIGEPLLPLPAHEFLPVLQQLTQNSFPDLQHFTASSIIRDSSQLVPQDWQILVEQILQLHTQGFDRFLLIHGTDTLAYTAAFLAAYLAATSCDSLQIVVTGSQYPLLDKQGKQLNPNSDAFINLQTAYQYLTQQLSLQTQPGCWVAFDQQVWPAHSVQKVHTADLPAFKGNVPQQNRSAIKPTDLELAKLAHLNIAIFYVLPIALEQQAAQLAHILKQPQLQAVIVLAFGAGNLAQHELMEQVLQQAYAQHILVILSTQVPFGGVHAHYAAGHWLGDFGVLSAHTLTLPAIYARLALLFCQDLSFSARRKQWQQALQTCC